MSIRAALESDVYLTYAGVIAGVLVLAGAVLGISSARGADVRSIWRTYRGWLVMAPLVLVVILLGREATIIGLVLVAIFGFKEFARATGLYSDWWMTGAVYLGILGMGAAMLVEDPRTGASGWYGLFMAMPAYVVAVILIVPIARNRTKGQLQAVALAILGFVYLGWMFGHLGLLANSPLAYGYLLYVVFAVEINDIAAFTCGKMFGRRPLRSSISPQQDSGRRARGSDRLDDRALVDVLLLPALHGEPVVARGADRRSGWTARRSLDQPHQARHRHQGHGCRRPGTRRDLGPHRQSDLRRSALPTHGPLDPRSPVSAEWQYHPAPDLEEGVAQRLQGFRAEPTMLAFGVRSLAALLLRGWLRTYHGLRIHGREHLPLERSFILIGNHASHLDALALTASIPLGRLHNTYPAAAVDYFFKSLPRTIFSAVVINALRSSARPAARAASRCATSSSRGQGTFS